MSLHLPAPLSVQVGTWPYVCTVLGHKKMKGVIEVVERERKY